jgi:glycosyltransferase involved in cell wall biosynthesis
MVHLLAAACSVPLVFLALGPLKMGLEGVALAVGLPLTIAYGVYVSAYGCKRLDIPWTAFFSRAFRMPLLCAAPLAICLIAFRLLTWDQPLRGLWLGTTTGAEIIYLPCARHNFDVACIWHTYQLCKRLGCDVVHCDNIHASPLIGAALAGVPVRLWSKHSMSPAYETMRQMTLRDRVVPSTRMSARLATRILAVSTAVRNELVDLGIPSSKIMVCPNPVETGRTVGRDREARTKLGYGDDAVVFTTVGHAVPVKGWDILLHAFAAVVSKWPHARLQLVGSVTDKHEQEHYSVLQRYVHQAGIANYVCFRGACPEVWSILAATDVFVLPSRSEGYSNALLEAMTAGLPCIAARVGAAADVIEDGVNGLLVGRGNEDQLCNAMVSLAASPERRAQMADAVRARGQYAPTFSEYGDRLVEICKELLRIKSGTGHQPVSSGVIHGIREA